MLKKRSTSAYFWTPLTKSGFKTSKPITVRQEISLPPRIKSRSEISHSSFAIRTQEIRAHLIMFYRDPLIAQRTSAEFPMCMNTYRARTCRLIFYETKFIFHSIYPSTSKEQLFFKACHFTSFIIDEIVSDLLVNPRIEQGFFGLNAGNIDRKPISNLLLERSTTNTTKK